MVPLQFVRVSGKELPNTAPAFACSEGPAPERASSSQAPLAGKPPKGCAGFGGSGGAGAVAVGAFEGCAGSGAGGATSSTGTVLGRLWLVFAAGRTASSLGLRGLDGHGFRSRLRGRLFSSRRRSLVHHGGFCILSHLSYSRKSIFHNRGTRKKKTLVPRVFTVFPSTSVSLNRRERRVMGPWSFTKCPSSVLVDITKPRPALMIHLHKIS